MTKLESLNLGKCANDGSDLVFKKEYGYYICNHCDYSVSEEEYDMAVMQPREEEYHVHTSDENLQFLNSL